MRHCDKAGDSGSKLVVSNTLDGFRKTIGSTRLGSGKTRGTAARCTAESFVRALRVGEDSFLGVATFLVWRNHTAVPVRLALRDFRSDIERVTGPG